MTSDEGKPLPPNTEEGKEWKMVRYIKIIPKRFKENFELKFKDIVKTGN